MRYSDHEQRQMDIASGEELDRQVRPQSDSVEWLRMMRDHSGLMDCRPHFARIADELERLREQKSVPMDAADLLKRAEAALASVERDTHYGLHDGDFCIPFGESRLPRHASYDDCTCVLCAIRKHLSEPVQ